MSSEIRTNWTSATTDIDAAIVALLSCLDHHINAWLEVRKNGSQELPLLRINPLLDDPFNWVATCGIPRTKEHLQSPCLNETQRDLMYNWVEEIATEEAAEAYKRDGTLMKGLMFGGKVPIPVRIADANRYREEIVKDNYKYNFWMNWWKPKDGIPARVVDDRIDRVFTLCYTEDPVNKQEAIAKGGKFLTEYADLMKKNNLSSMSVSAGPSILTSSPEPLTAKIVLEYQTKVKQMVPLKAGPYKRLGAEFKDRFGLTTRDAIDLLNNRNTIEILAKYE